MELEFHWIISTARHVIKKPRVFIDLLDVCHFERVTGERCEQFAVEIVQIEILPAGPLGSPDEPLAVLKKSHRGKVLRPTRGPFLAHDDAAFAGLRVARAELHHILAAIGAMEEQLLALGSPKDMIDVVSNN